MSTNNRISIIIPEEVIAEVTDKLNEIKAALQPYLQALTNDERRDIPKMSDKSFSFVSKVNYYCESNQEFIPAFMDAEELNTDIKAVASLKPINALCEQLCANINDTMMLSGSEAYTASLMYYSNVKLAAKTGQASARPIFEDLNQRFPRRRKASSEAEAHSPSLV